MDGGRAQAIPGGPGEAREGRLARHLPALRDDADPDAGGQPRPEVLPPAEQPDAQEAQVQPLRRGTLRPVPSRPSVATLPPCETCCTSPGVCVSDSRTSSVSGGERREGGDELHQGHGAPAAQGRHHDRDRDWLRRTRNRDDGTAPAGPVARRRQATSEARPRRAASEQPAVPAAAAVLGGNWPHGAEPGPGAAETQPPFFVADGGKGWWPGAGPGAEDLDRPAERAPAAGPDGAIAAAAAAAAAEDALSGDHQGHMT
jgi:hypothetical protein|uniref:Uncharacterized protein n=1 Tax=Zea mays TaxID=4577 RepID=A0A804MYI0_MAIZE